MTAGGSKLLVVTVLSALCRLYQAVPHPPWLPTHLQSIDATGIPGYNTVFQGGECDKPWAGPSAINANMTCFSCFRIPSLLRNPSTGSILAFGEARRGCEDIPDTRIGFKISRDGGWTWSQLRILAENPDARSADGVCRNQPVPVIDNATGTIFLAFNYDCRQGGALKAMFITSKDDGDHWSPPQQFQSTSGGTLPQVVIGLGEGLSIPLNESTTRLIIPAETYGPIYSDNHGATWSVAPRIPAGDGHPAGAGENAIARCTPGACGGRKFAMSLRGVGKGKTAAVYMTFSDDAIHWDPPRQLHGLDRYTTYPQRSGLIGVPGGLLLSHGGSAGGLTGKGDGGGMDLFASVDGMTWKLLRRLWPQGLRGGYSTITPLEVDHQGGALTYGLLMEFGGILSPWSQLAFQNFTFSPHDLDGLH